MEHDAIHKRHDFDRLDKQLSDLLEVIDMMSDRKDSLKELIRIWRRPGWTTPAEFYFSDLTLESLVNQAKTLEYGIDRFEKGVHLVGR